MPGYMCLEYEVVLLVEWGSANGMLTIAGIGIPYGSETGIFIDKK